MSILSIFASQVALYASFSFYFARQENPLRSVSFNTYLGILLALGGFIGSVYSFPITETIIISGGSLLYGAFMMTTVLFVIIERDVGVIRRIVRLVIVVNILNILVLTTVSQALKNTDIINPFNTSASLFSVSVAFLILGGVLIIAELILLIFIFEKIKKKYKNWLTVSILYILVFILVLCLDGILFPVIAFAFNPNLISIIVGGIPGKLIMAVAYSIPMFIFLVVYRVRLKEFMDLPLTLLDLINAPREKLLEKIKTQESSLVQSEEKFRHLAESIDDIFFSIDSEMRFKYWNKSSETIGFTEEDVIGKRIYDVFPDIRNTGLDVFYQSVLQTGESSQYAEQMSSQGQDKIFAVSAYPYGNGLSVIMRDITEFKEMESQLLQIQKMDSIGQLAGGIAHDFNNILVPITAYSELGMESSDPEDKHFAYFEGTYKAAVQAAGLTNQILAFSRKQVLEVRVLELNDLLVDFKSMIQRLIGEDINCTFILGSNLGRIGADKSQVEQVILNLVVNARDAMPQGGTLTIESKNVILNESSNSEHADFIPFGQYVLLLVKDTGIGMDSNIQNKIFEPFFTSKNLHEGTGLGLATAFGIVKQHNGYITVTSSPGNGATFGIYLPRSEDPLIDTKTYKTESEYPKVTETVLVVEDDEEVRSVVCEMLESRGYKVIEAESAAEGLKQAATTHEVDLVLTDIVMPDTNGLELYQELVLSLPELKVLFMSGYTDDVIADQGILDEGVNYIRKPFSVNDLLKKVRNALDQ